MRAPQLVWRERFDTPEPLERRVFEANAMLEVLLINVRALTRFLFATRPTPQRQAARSKRNKAGGQE
jgi:hypothetical protein